MASYLNIKEIVISHGFTVLSRPNNADARYHFARIKKNGDEEYADNIQFHPAAEKPFAAFQTCTVAGKCVDEEYLDDAETVQACLEWIDRINRKRIVADELITFTDLAHAHREGNHEDVKTILSAFIRIKSKELNELQ